MNTSSLIGHVLQLLEHIDVESQPADRLTADFFRSKKYLGSRDRHFITEAVFGMIRHHRLIKSLLKQFVSENPTTAALEGPHVRYLSQYAVYSIAVENQSYFSSTLWKTHFPKIDYEHFAGWIQNNLALNFLKDNALNRLAVKYSFQDWMVKEWIPPLANEIEQFLLSMNTPAFPTIRVNTRKVTRDECRARLKSEGIETDPTIYSPHGLRAKKRFNSHAVKAFKDGLFEMQDEGSQIISLIANPQPDNIVIDGCAGAGGKSLHMAEIMNHSGEIIAIDNNFSRLKELKTRAVRAGVDIVKPLAQKLLKPENFFSKADIVLVDAPCSGVGTIRRNPGLKWSVTESNVQYYSERQLEILEFNSHFVKPSGKLVYSTCSLLKKENEEVIELFLSRHGNFKLISPAEQFNAIGIKIEQPLVTLYPHRFGTDGFFIAVLTRID